MNWGSEPVKLLLAGGISEVETQDGPTGGDVELWAHRPADHLGAPPRSLPFQHHPNTKLGDWFVSFPAASLLIQVNI